MKEDYTIKHIRQELISIHELLALIKQDNSRYKWLTCCDHYSSRRYIIKENYVYKKILFLNIKFKNTEIIVYDISDHNCLKKAYKENKENLFEAIKEGLIMIKLDRIDDHNFENELKNIKLETKKAIRDII